MISSCLLCPGNERVSFPSKVGETGEPDRGEGVKERAPEERNEVLWNLKECLQKVVSSREVKKSCDRCRAAVDRMKATRGTKLFSGATATQSPLLVKQPYLSEYLGLRS